MGLSIKIFFFKGKKKKNTESVSPNAVSKCWCMGGLHTLPSTSDFRMIRNIKCQVLEENNFLELVSEFLKELVLLFEALGGSEA